MSSKKRSNFDASPISHKHFLLELDACPDRIEHHFRITRKEFSIGYGRIDLIGIDGDGVLCLVEVKTKPTELLAGKRQIVRYRKELLAFLSIAGVKLAIRAIVVTPNKVLDVGTKVSVPIIGVTARDVPTSREVYGLKVRLRGKRR